MNILITGATGSFGHVFVRFLLAHRKPERVVIYSRDEMKQEQMAQELGDNPCLRFFIGDVRDERRLEMAMHGITTVVHAAALKIVPTAEYNPTECVATNIGGAENVVRASIRAGVRRVLALSTDKAVNPTNLYGATKLTAERIFIAANSLGAGATRFSVLRYGNVVGSRGSVVPLFHRLRKEGKAFTITDGRMTRFWITLDQAVEFSINCLQTMTGGEVFVPKIPSMKIVDLAKAMSDDPNPAFEIIGIRPGEKLHETLISEDESRYAHDHGSYFVIGRRPWNTGQEWSYRSDNNSNWLSIEDLRKIL